MHNHPFSIGVRIFEVGQPIWPISRQDSMTSLLRITTQVFLLCRAVQLPESTIIEFFTKPYYPQVSLLRECSEHSPNWSHTRHVQVLRTLQWLVVAGVMHPVKQDKDVSRKRRRRGRPAAKKIDNVRILSCIYGDELLGSDAQLANMVWHQVNVHGNDMFYLVTCIRWNTVAGKTQPKE